MLDQIEAIGIDQHEVLDLQAWLYLYTQMRRMRAIEDRGRELYSAMRMVGRLYTGRGQEAISVGAAYALEPRDVLAPLYRDLGALLVRGVTAREVMLQYMGRADSFTRGKDSGIHIADTERGLVSMISNLTTSLPVAVGVALAFKLRHEARVALTFLGDGSTSTGSAHEGLNMAAVQRLPVVFVCENNQWALSTPNSQQFAIGQLVERAAAYGMPGVRVDGNDVLAVYRVTHAAAERARRGDGPTFIEAVTMRMDGHSVTDLATYVPRPMLAEWSLRDPIAQFGAFLRERGALTNARDEEITRELAEEIQDAEAYADTAPFARPEEALTDVFAESPDA